VSFPDANAGYQIPQVAGLSVLLRRLTIKLMLLSLHATLWMTDTGRHTEQFCDCMICDSLNSESKFCSSAQWYNLWLRECSLVRQCPLKTNGQTPQDRNLRSNNIAITKMHITSAITPILPNSKLKANKLGRTKCLYSTRKRLLQNVRPSTCLSFKTITVP
jgi:hypothetical protein